MHVCERAHQMKRLLGNIQIQIIFSHGPSFLSRPISFWDAFVRNGNTHAMGSTVRQYCTLVTNKRDDMRGIQEDGAIFR